MVRSLRLGRLYDATLADPAENVTVTIDGDRFGTVTRSKDRPPLGDQDLDLGSYFGLPGLIDAHTHLGQALPVNAIRDEGLISIASVAAGIFQNCELALEAGVTTARDLAGLDGGIVQAIDSGLVRGPRMYPSGPALAQTGGHGSGHTPYRMTDAALCIPGLFQRALVCDGPDGVRLAARTALRRGATQLKVYGSGGVVSFADGPRDVHFTIEELKAAVEEATARHTYVTSHAHNSEAIRRGIAAGVTCFEHGTYLDEPTAELMANAGASLVPTFMVLEVMRQRSESWGIGPELLDRMAGVSEAMQKALSLATDAGVRIGSGSDLLGPQQAGRAFEVELKARIIGFRDALSAATIGNAEIMGLDADLGTVESGKIADLIVVDGNPFDDPAVLSDPENVKVVIKSGVVVKDIR
ncbi:imidazolonepropionase-like amidohydrolase [Prauserella shujinwangii]|uniref:Imidazolonepropionase-like amidohydrolase n=1 Tax=Prauserella shujinwangii TaxID=1453103 RepID=A0A2T0M0I8_9PSEU|nr:amidohydrolase family protein [Prauserella shujinwangii]PRX50077.1 imidazolonepropionase-like amidohydrolase [Prauserella shujinwangii]